MPERLFLRLDEDPLHGPEADIPAGTLRAWPVIEPLRSHVAHVLLYRETIPSGCEVLERVVPDGAVRLVFNLGAVPSVGTQAGRPAEALGASATPVIVRLSGRVDGLAVTLRPGAAHAARLIAASGGQMPLREVADAIGVGERRQQQLFHAHVGLSPRGWRRLARLHGCLRRLRRAASAGWATLAADSGFYDQSHLVNEFRALCGLTPTEFLSRSTFGFFQDASLTARVRWRQEDAERCTTSH